LPNTLVVMAGGLGTRLRPITESCPKPLVEVNGHSVLHRLLANAAITGIRNVVISVRYLSEMIVAAVGNGDQYGLSITYINESIPLGTAGALTLIDSISEPVVCVLGDVLIDIDYRDLMEYHIKMGASSTMVTSMYSHKVPFGVVRSDLGNITAIDEKPVYDFQINAGVIVVNPDIIQSFPKGCFLTQPDIITHCINAGKIASEYPYRGNWIDIGTHEDLKRARR
jgi:NDP-sugar pyrophosphorylase family protein